MENEFQMKTEEGFKLLDQESRDNLVSALQTDSTGIIQKALNKVNKIIAKYGFQATIEIKFHKVEIGKG